MGRSSNSGCGCGSRSSGSRSSGSRSSGSRSSGSNFFPGFLAGLVLARKNSSNNYSSNNYSSVYSYSTPPFLGLRFRPFSLDCSLSIGDVDNFYVGLKPTLDYAGSFSFKQAPIGYLQYEVPISDSIFASAKVSSRKNVGLAINHKLNIAEGCYVESMIGLSSHAFNIPSLVYGFSLNFQLD
jgi:hypothetical protein